MLFPKLRMKSIKYFHSFLNIYCFDGAFLYAKKKRAAGKKRIKTHSKNGTILRKRLFSPPLSQNVPSCACPKIHVFFPNRFIFSISLNSDVIFFCYYIFELC